MLMCIIILTDTCVLLLFCFYQHHPPAFILCSVARAKWLYHVQPRCLGLRFFVVAI